MFCEDEKSKSISIYQRTQFYYRWGKGGGVRKV